ncbi:class I SAM-dependent methyltransferase [Actinokineospora fastidiosa]|uniref:Methyltransferase n=1 Tax=Actinokineospora fastidiosa TaxID=1816 RepID=A0A918LG80_9PSEU|nr:class I SAM-dependent methyltransferase [Actinokineospora fastidiosa]GGS43009.1 methyltransferase [Actinokineospora fastidiosa]
MNVDQGNTAQLEAWNGPRGAFWADNLARFERCVARYLDHLMAAAAITPTEHVLDIGCGGGQTTREAARRGASALGVDLSEPMLAMARRAGGDNVEFVRADAQIHPFPERRFDVAISRHGTMFFGDPVAAFANIASALTDGGRLALITWQPLERNEFLTAFRAALAGGRDLPAPPDDAPSPFALSRPERVRHILGAAGFVDVEMTALSEPMDFGDADAYDFIADHYGDIADGLDDDAKARAFAALRESVEAHRTENGVRYGSAAWLITARRRAS